MSQKVAIVADNLIAPGGSEKIVQTMYELFPKSQIFTTVFNPSRFTWLDPVRVTTSFLQKLPFKRQIRKHYYVLSPIVLENFDFSDYDLVVSVTAGCAKGIITGIKTRHVSIICIPPRSLWLQSIGASEVQNPLLRLFEPFTKYYLRLWDYEAGQRPDTLISISKFVRNNVKKIYGRDSSVLYPGIDLKFWSVDNSVAREDYYVIVSRLRQYKKIDIAIEACKMLGKKLKIVGEGQAEKSLKKLSAQTENIVFSGYLQDEDARDIVRKARGFIFPGIEDFGLAPVEAMACGTPVIAYNRGGLAESVSDGISGILYDNPSVHGLMAAMRKFEKTKFSPDTVADSVVWFSKEKFIENFSKILNNER